MIIGITGLPGAGKGTAAAYLVEKYGVKSYRFSTPLRDILNRVYQPITRRNMQELARILRELFGKDVLGETLLKDLEKERSPLAIMEGMRYQDEYNILKNNPSFKLVAVEVPFDIRLQRIRERGENEDDTTLTPEQFAKQHEHETERGIADLIKFADYHVDNSGSVDALHQQLDAIVKKAQG